jgi:hypothetical protein
MEEYVSQGNVLKPNIVEAIDLYLYNDGPPINLAISSIVEVIEIIKLMSLGKAVLLHCKSGVMRSPTVAIAFIMKRQKLPLDKAVQLVSTQRPGTKIDNDYRSFLAKFFGEEDDDQDKKTEGKRVLRTSPRKQVNVKKLKASKE